MQKIKTTITTLCLTFLFGLTNLVFAQTGKIYTIDANTGEMTVTDAPGNEDQTLVVGTPVLAKRIKSDQPITPPRTINAVISGSDLGGADLTPSNGDVLSGTFTNVGKFHIPSGVTVFVDPGVALAITADEILIEGTLDGTGAGFAGGVTPATKAAPGVAGSGSGGGDGGGYGSTVHGPGGGGGSYGGVGGTGGTPFFNFPPHALGGPSYGAAAPPGVTPGSGGGSAANHGSTNFNLGGAGGNGGGAIILTAPAIGVINGSILADGADGLPGMGVFSATLGVSGGGGGSGGGIWLNGCGITLTNALLSAHGGDGGSTQATTTGGWGMGGGGGGGGRIKLSGSLHPASVYTTNVTGGAPGNTVASHINVAPTAGASGSVASVSLPTITCNQDPTSDAGEDQQVCTSGGSADVTLDGSGSSDPDGDALTYTWKQGATTIATGENPTVSLSVGTHTIELTVDDGNGGTDTDDVVIEVFASPSADAGSDATIFAGGETAIGGVTTASGGTGALTIAWTPTTGLDDASSANPTAEIYSTTTYTVTVTDENGCVDTDDVTVTVLSKEDVITQACADVQALIDDSGTPEDAIDPLEEAKEALEEAFEFAEEGDVKKTLDAMRDAAEALEEAREEHADTDPVASVLADCARHTATEKREAAYDCDPNPSGKMADDIEDGDNDLADGDDEYDDGYFGDAIKDYCKAWEDYCDALDRCENPKAVNSEQSTVNSSQITVHSFALHQNYPNPFNPSTTIQFDLIESGNVSLNIYNSAGQLVRSLVSGDYAPGAHKVVWDARDDSGARVASGLYLYTIKVGQQFTAQRKLLLMK